MTVNSNFITAAQLIKRLESRSPNQAFLCCEHCVPCSMGEHPTPCQHVDDNGYKDCVTGQIPVEVIS